MEPIENIIQVKVTPIYDTPENLRKAEQMAAIINWFIKHKQLEAEMN